MVLLPSQNSRRAAFPCISPSPDAPNRASSTVFPTMAKRCEALTWCDANTAPPSVFKTVDEPPSHALHDLRLHQIGPRRPFVETQPRGSVPDETHPRSVIRCGADSPRAPNPAPWTRIAASGLPAHARTHPRSAIRRSADSPRAPNPAPWTRIATRRNRFPVRSTFFILEQTLGQAHNW